MHREMILREIQERYRQSGRSLNELERRHWAAAEVLRLGRGGMSLVSEALHISPNTIKRGIQELSSDQTSGDASSVSRIRKPGGGRKSKSASANRVARSRAVPDYGNKKTPKQGSDSAADQLFGPTESSSLNGSSDHEIGGCDLLVPQPEMP